MAIDLQPTAYSLRPTTGGEHRGVPWYRQLWPWLVMLPPLAAVLGGIVTLVLAFTHQEDDMRAHPTEFLGVPHEEDPGHRLLATGQMDSQAPHARH
jgi:hypothetical protein